MGSVWEVASAPAAGVRGSAPASGDYDVAVVGAGITGLSTALALAEAGRRVIVLEALRVGRNNTGDSTGNLYSTVAQGLTPITRKWGLDTARDVVAVRAQALDRIEATVQRYGIDCDFARRSLYLVAGATESADGSWLEDEHEICRAAGIDAELIDRAPLPFSTGTTLALAGQAQFNPLRYLQGLAAAVVERGGVIHEHSAVSDMDADAGRLTVGGAEIRANAIVQATHTPKGVSVLQTGLLPYREYAVAARLHRPSYPEGGFWMLDSGHSIRGYRHNAAEYLVAVGEKHKTGDAASDTDPHERLRAYLRDHFDVAGFEHHWSAQQFAAADRLPYIGRAPGTEATYVATGFAADGLVWGTAAGTIIADLIAGRDNGAAALLAPTRLTPAKSARSWLRENISVASHFTRDRLSSEQIERLGEIASGEGRVVTLDNEKLAVYRDHHGRLSVLSAICPHMRCVVHWNGTDHTWDCPCHGSRFRADGAPLEGPAYQGLAHRVAQE